MKEKVLVTGGAGYVGSVLVPKLLERNFDVRVIDLMMFGSHGLESVRDKCEIIQGDIRDSELVRKCMKGIDSVIHLAAIANDPCSNLNPELTKQVNFEATKNIVSMAKENKARRFIYASSSSVYGIREEENVTEDLELMPLTIYSKTKAWAEQVITENASQDFVPVCIRSATVCGYSPRQRLDLIVNILASDAILKREITVNGGEQKRPNVHIEDITNLYTNLLDTDENKIRGEIFNYGKENYTVNQIAKIIRDIIGEDVKIKMNPKTADSRSYHISSEKIEQQLAFYPKKTISDAVIDLKTAFENRLIPEPESSKYRNIARMKEINLK